MRNRANPLLWVGIVCLIAFVGLVAYQKFAVARQRFVAQKDLLAELADAVFVEDKHAPGDWPQWRGTLRDGITSMPDLLRDWPDDGPPRKWKKPGGDGYSSFAVTGGKVFTMLPDDDKEAVVCWDLATGNERWRHKYDPGRGFDYGGPRATPTIHQGKLYTVSAAGRLMCLGIEDGQVVWQRDLVQEYGAQPPRWGFAFSPLIEGDRVYVPPLGSRQAAPLAFHKDSGEPALVATIRDPSGYSSPVAATIGGVRQIVYFTGNRVFGMTAAEGQLVWEYLWGTSFEVNAATPIVVAAKSGEKEIAYVFISSGYDKGSALVRVVRDPGGAFAAQAVYETGDLGCHFASPVRYKDHLYALDEKRDLTCFHLRTGKVVWRFERDETKEDQELRQRGYKKGSLIRVDDVLVVLGEDGKLALVEATPTAYREIAACRPFRSRCWVAPVVAEGMLLMRDQRQVFALDVRKPR